MKNQLIAAFILLIFGIAFVVAAFQFAPLAYAAPSSPGNQYHATGGPTILEFVYGFPAGVFIVTGVIAVIASTLVACLAFFGVKTNVER